MAWERAAYLDGGEHGQGSEDGHNVVGIRRRQVVEEQEAGIPKSRLLLSCKGSVSAMNECVN
jgi:hypothetical protein